MVLHRGAAAGGRLPDCRGLGLPGSVREGRTRGVVPSAPPAKGSQALPGARRARFSREDRRQAMNTMTYSGYTARVAFDEEDEVFTGRVLGINDVVGFHAETVSGLKQAFHEAVDDYLATCRHLGKEPEKAFSGRVMFRVAPEVHAGAALAAERSGKSLNQWAEEALAAAVRKSAPTEPQKKMRVVIRSSKRPEQPSSLKSSAARERIGRR